MRDRSKQLLVINTGKKESEQTRLPVQSGTTHIIGGGGLSVNMSDYLLKSIWDKVFEIRTDGQGTEYIFGKIPVVTQYGITMYADGGDIDLPSLYTGLPIDGKTLIRDEKGVLMVNPDIELGGGVSNFWDLSGIPSWITNSKPKYSYSEIEGTPDLSVYAQVDTLKAYVTLAGAQNINGEKNFIGGLKVNGSPIIYDSVNKCWKLQGNLVLTGGITMYADDGTLNLPSIYDGLPIDGTTIYWDTDAAGNRVLKAVGGGGTADSVAWNNITGKPSWIGSSKPVYSYSEIQGTPDLSVYALKTQIPSLSGYATESWVTKQNYATKATTLSGYGITDAYTKTNVDDLLKAYVTLSGEQTISGKKNFTTGGLFVNGSQIKYDATKKYWKLEGDLLVTGGVTMYGSDSSFTPSTIMDAIAVDGTTISKSGGVLKVIGGTGGGVADSVAWANITGKPTWIGSSKPTYSYSEITGAISTTELQNYLTSNSYLNVTSGDNRYLQLSGGTLSSNSRSPLTLKSGSSENHSLLLFNRGSDYWGSIGFNAANSLIFKDTNGANYTIWHSGNDGSGSGLDADLLDGKHNGELTAIMLHSGGGSVLDANEIKFSDYALRFFSPIPNTSTNFPTFTGYQNGLLALPIHSNGATAQLYFTVGKNPYYRSHHTYEWNELAYKTDNVASATKLQTARTIWGHDFDGTENVFGQLYLNASKIVWHDDANNYYIGCPTVTGGAMLEYKAYSGHAFLGGNVGIGTASPQQKLHVEGHIWANGDIAAKTKIQSFGNLIVNGNVGIGTTMPTTKFDINGKSMEVGTSVYGSGGVGSEIYMSTHREGSTLCARGMRMYVSGSATGYFQSFAIDAKNYGTLTNIMSIDSSGNLLVVGGITMYSDQRKKTILNHVELSLKQIAEAPLIEHYYNGDDKRTIHVGSIAQYWASMNDWFCKVDSEGYYTMEIQNAALASAISIARELDRYETKTDKAIKKLKKRICELEEEVERLKAS